MSVRDKLKHLILPNPVKEASFSPVGVGGGGEKKLKNRSHAEHGGDLKNQLQEAKRKLSKLTAIITFTNEEDVDLDFKSFETNGLELLSIKQTDDGMIANVLFKDKDSFDKFEKKINSYSETEKNKSLLANIKKINNFSAKDLFMDDISLFPSNNILQIWWELWLDLNIENVTDVFNKGIKEKNIIHNPKGLEFPDRLVFLVKCNVSELEDFICDYPIIAEIRKPKEMSKRVYDFQPEEQKNILDNLLSRIKLPINDNIRLVVLDTGVSSAHPLLKQSIKENKICLESFEYGDSDGHGTMMSGLVLFGDINKLIDNSDDIDIKCNIESVKIIDRIPNDPELYGYITKKAVAMTEDEKKKAYVMAISDDYKEDYKDFGKPTSYSAPIDDICYEQKKLFFISVGNFNGNIQYTEYKIKQEQSCVEDPAQAWNAISVGAYTELCDANLLKSDGCFPYALSGDISPYSRTSCLFHKQWPVKPEVLFEGGNKIIHSDGNVMSADVFELVSCNHEFTKKGYFNSIQATSAATALAGKFAGELMVEYPHFWAETIRGLMVHSAEWTNAMKDKLPKNPNKGDICKLMRWFGYGVPNILKAKHSASNSLTMIVQQEFQVYEQKFNKDKKAEKGKKQTRIIHFPLPWPKAVLQEELFNKKVRLKVTLSYFISPNPSSRGYKMALD